MWDQAVHVFCRRYVVDFIRCVAGEQDHRTGDSLELRFGEVPDRVGAAKAADQRRITAQNSCTSMPSKRSRFDGLS